MRIINYNGTEVCQDDVQTLTLNLVCCPTNSAFKAQSYNEGWDPKPLKTEGPIVIRKREGA